MIPPAAQPSAFQKLLVLAIPWVFLTIFAAILFGVMLPRAGEGHALAVVLSAVMGLAFCCSSLAAITFSRDVLTGRYPG